MFSISLHVFNVCGWVGVARTGRVLEHRTGARANASADGARLPRLGAFSAAFFQEATWGSVAHRDRTYVGAREAGARLGVGEKTILQARDLVGSCCSSTFQSAQEDALRSCRDESSCFAMFKVAWDEAALILFLPLSSAIKLFPGFKFEARAPVVPAPPPPPAPGLHVRLRSKHKVPEQRLPRKEAKPSFLVQAFHVHGTLHVGDNDRVLGGPIVIPPKFIESTGAKDIFSVLSSCVSLSSELRAKQIAARKAWIALSMGGDSLWANKLVLHRLSQQVDPLITDDNFCIGHQVNIVETDSTDRLRPNPVCIM